MNDKISQCKADIQKLQDELKRLETIEPKDGMVFKCIGNNLYYLLKEFEPNVWCVIWNSSFCDKRIPGFNRYSKAEVQKSLNAGFWTVV